MEDIQHEIFTQKVTFYNEKALKLDSGGAQLCECTENHYIVHLNVVSHTYLLFIY